MPQFYFTVAQQPDIVNTAVLDRNPVSRYFTFRSINNSAITRPLRGDVSESILPVNFSCSVSANNAVMLSGNYLTIQMMPAYLCKLLFEFLESCNGASVDSTVSQVIPNVTITFTSPPVLQPVHPSANAITLHIWTPGDVALSVSDSTLEIVHEWKSTCNAGPDRYQTARIMAITNFTSGSNQFTANILPFVANRVSVYSKLFCMYIMWN